MWETDKVIGCAGVQLLLNRQGRHGNRACRCAELISHP